MFGCVLGGDFLARKGRLKQLSWVPHRGSYSCALLHNVVAPSLELYTLPEKLSVSTTT